MNHEEWKKKPLVERLYDFGHMGENQLCIDAAELILKLEKENADYKKFVEIVSQGFKYVQLPENTPTPGTSNPQREILSLDEFAQTFLDNDEE